jgi:hypothetical protein
MTTDDALDYVERVRSNWAGPIQAEYALCALASEVRRLRTCGVVEIMCQNVNVDSFVREHEQRTAKAEAGRDGYRDEGTALHLALETMRAERDALMRAINPVGFGMPNCTVESCVGIVARMRSRETRIHPAGSTGQPQHVYPVNDTREHVMSSDCFCCPTPDHEEPNLWIHHADDMREKTKS